MDKIERDSLKGPPSAAKMPPETRNERAAARRDTPDTSDVFRRPNLEAYGSSDRGKNLDLPHPDVECPLMRLAFVNQPLTCIETSNTV